MSTLASKLEEKASARRESNVERFLKELDETDRKAVWKALRDDDTWKTYSLLAFLRENGARFDKATFVPFRRAVLAGDIKEEDVHGAQ